MPYVKQQDRDFYEEVNALIRARMYVGASRQPEEPGSLTTGVLTYLVAELGESYRAAFGDSYQVFSEIMAAFENGAREFYRRVVAPYEDQKRAENGDVYVPVTEPPF